MALFGSVSATTGAAVTEEEHIAYKGGYIRVKNGISLSAVSVMKGATSLVEGVDYEVKGGGVLILKTTTLVTNGDTVKINYTHASATVVEAAVNSGAEYKLIFDGFNSANSDKPVVLDIHRATCSPAGIGLIVKEFGTIGWNFELLKDEAIT